jgi:hypothetical protein
VRGEVINRGLDRRHGVSRGIWVLIAQKLKGAFDVFESPIRID